MGASTPEYSPSYRERDVDETLEEHDMRITRLEKAGLIAAGYIVGTASLSIPDIITALL